MKPNSVNSCRLVLPAAKHTRRCGSRATDGGWTEVWQRGSRLGVGWSLLVAEQRTGKHLKPDDVGKLPGKWKPPGKLPL